MIRNRYLPKLLFAVNILVIPEGSSYNFEVLLNFAVFEVQTEQKMNGRRNELRGTRVALF